VKRLLTSSIIGVIDPSARRQLTEAAFFANSHNRAKVVVIDIMVWAGNGRHGGNSLVQTVEASRLIGATSLSRGFFARDCTDAGDHRS